MLIGRNSFPNGLVLLAMISFFVMIFLYLFIGSPELLKHYLLGTDYGSTLPQEIICVEDPEMLNSSGLEHVKFLSHTNVEKGEGCEAKIIPMDMNMTSKTEMRVRECVRRYEKDYQVGHSGFWNDPKSQFVRHNHHTYLNNQSLVIDVGGNVGEDASIFLEKYNPHTYIILEPLQVLYRRLLQKFKNNKHVKIYNIGLGKRNERFMVKAEGHEADATSIFDDDSGTGNCSLKVVNSTSFFLKLGIGCFEVDLITINCEGCEFELLEVLVSTNLINFFKHVQFATHPKLPRILQPVHRYCRVQELLLRTHRLTYQYKFNWETWTRKDL